MSKNRIHLIAKAHKGRIRFDNGAMEVVINTQTGLIDRYRVAGIDYLQKNAFCPLVIAVDADPWGSNVHGFKNVSGAFSLMTRTEGRSAWTPEKRLAAESERLDSIDREALALNEKPYFLALCPSGQGHLPKSGLALSDSVKKSEAGQDLIIRLFEPTGKKRSATLSLPALGLKKQVNLTPFEIQTWRVNPRNRKMFKTNLLEKVTTQNELIK